MQCVLRIPELVGIGSLLVALNFVCVRGAGDMGFGTLGGIGA